MRAMTALSEDAPLLGALNARRVAISLIASHQDAMLRDRRLTRDQLIGAVLANGSGAADTTLEIDEDRLGLDSLAMIDLVSRFERFFGLSATGVEDYLLHHRDLGTWAALLQKHFELVGAGAAICFETSGSTGTPKKVRHRGATLVSEIEAIATGPFGGSQRPRRILCSVPTHHIYGFLWGALLPDRWNLPSVDLPVGLPGPVIRHARPGDLIIGTPNLWEKLVEHGEKLPGGVVGVTSGAPSTQGTWEAVGLGLDRLIEVYGSSETGGVGWRERSDDPFRLFPGLSRAGDVPVQDGEQHPLPIQDHLAWASSGTFRVLGRKDDTVQVGGTNVDLAKLSACLRSVPGVADIALRLDGDRLKCFVATALPECDLPDLEIRLRQGLLRLPAPARPDRFTFGPHLPRTAAGKPADWPVAPSMHS